MKKTKTGLILLKTILTKLENHINDTIDKAEVDVKRVSYSIVYVQVLSSTTLLRTFLDRERVHRSEGGQQLGRAGSERGRGDVGRYQRNGGVSAGNGRAIAVFTASTGTCGLQHMAKNRHTSWSPGLNGAAPGREPIAPKDSAAAIVGLRDQILHQHF